MSANPDLERRLADFYATEAPARAPDWVLGSALATIDTTNQRRALIRVPRRFQNMNSFAKLAVAAVVVIAVGAVGLAVLRPGQAPVVGSDISPSPSASASPSPSSAPSEGSATEFRRPFTYVLPPDVGWDHGPTERTYYEFRIPDSAGDKTAVGVILRAISGGRVDPCAESSEPLVLPGGPQAVIEYLKTVPTVQVTEESSATVDGMTAAQAHVEAGEPTTDCPEVRPFAKDEWQEETEVISDAAHTRVTVVDVGGDHIVIWTYLTVDDTSWYAVADELIATFRFQPADT